MKLFKLVGGLVIALSLVVGLCLITSDAAVADTPPASCVLAHRGIGPENTISAFRRSIRKGACGFETDVRFTRDNVGVLNHDTTLNRTTTGKGRVTQRNWGYVSRLHVRNSSWGRPSGTVVATYHRGLLLCRYSKVRVCLFEAKAGDTPDQVLSMARDAVDLMGPDLYKVIIETDGLWASRIISTTYPQVSTAYVGFNRMPDIAAVLASGAKGIIVNRGVMSYSRVATARNNGLWVMPYGIETFSELAHVRRMGATGAMTDSSRLL